MLGIIKRLWTNWKIQRLKAKHHLNFELMRKENLPHDVIQDELLKQVADEYVESPKKKKKKKKKKPLFPKIESE